MKSRKENFETTCCFASFTQSFQVGVLRYTQYTAMNAFQRYST